MWNREKGGIERWNRERGRLERERWNREREVEKRKKGGIGRDVRPGQDRQVFPHCLRSMTEMESIHSHDSVVTQYQSRPNAIGGRVREWKIKHT